MTDPLVITTAGTYELQNDITTTTSPCIQISASDVIFDGMGHSIIGTDHWNRIGIQVQNSNVTVRNVTVSTWLRGLNYASAPNSRIEQVTSTTTTYGIWVESSPGVVINGSRVINGQYNDILVRSGSTGIQINNSQLSGPSQIGIRIEGSSHNVAINGSTVSGSTEDAIYLENSNGLNLTASWLVDNSRGIRLYNSHQNTVYNNQFRNSNNAFISGSTSTANIWNTTLAAGPNIIGGPFIGGNYWSQPDNLGFSQIHNDTDNNGICEDTYSLPGGTDLLPLHNYSAGSPVSSFTANITYGLIPLAVQFIDTTTNTPTAWNWSFGDGQFSPLQNPSHTYTVPGIYTVALKSENLYGNSTLQRTGYITARLLGDVNSNGAVDIGDVAGVAYMGVGLTSPVLSVADFNHNGEIDIGDAVKISYYFVGRVGVL
ncbi:MAG: hypothetical protein STSR0009_03680 [Methanoregula sp.]